MRLIIDHERGVFGARSPDVPGVFGVGRTRRAAERDFRLALATMSAYEADMKLHERVRAAIRAAKRLRGRERECALIRMCRRFAWVVLDHAVELELSKAVGECLGCVAAKRLPEDPPSGSKRRPRRRAL